MDDSQHPTDAIAAANQRSLQTLMRSLTLSQGQFSLIVVRCNYQRLQNQLIEQVQVSSTLKIRVFELPKTVPSLYPAVQSCAADNVPDALFVVGFDEVPHLDALFGNANLMREEFRKHLPFPVVIWLNDRGFQALTHYASDLRNWSTASIRFTFPIDELIQSLHYQANEIFHQLLTAGGDRFVSDTILNLEPGSRLRTELEFALTDIQSSGQSIDPALQASLDFLSGRDAQARLEMDQAKTFYEQSLAFWQQGEAANAAPEVSSADIPDNYRAGILLFHLGLWWRSYATLQRASYEASCQQARHFFDACLSVFRQAGRLDLVGKFIPALEETLQKLGDWSSLEELAEDAIALHRGRDPVRLARDYGFLAEAALARSQWSSARSFAQEALQILQRALPVDPHDARARIDAQDLEDSLSLATRFYVGWLFLLLGRSQAELGDREGAIASLQTAQQAVIVQDDPILYIRILRELRNLYFEQGYYREAFQAKQSRQRVEQQYGYRAFAGAGRLEPERLADLSEIAPSSPEMIVTQEIAASGRQQDVDRLIARIATPRDRLTVIHGPSGVGKSSILAAGLIPALAKETVEARRVLPILLSVYTDWVSALNSQLNHGLAVLGWPLPPSETPPTPDAVLAELRQNPDRYLHTVLIFDQFEEFFFACPQLSQREPFYQFIKACLNIPYVDVMLSIREDYLHYLLEIERLTKLDDIIADGILSKSVRYPLGDFTPDDAKTVIRTLTTRSQFILEDALIDTVVRDLTSETGGVRPIELQIVGAQLQQERNRIDTLAEYRELGDHPKETLVQRFLQEVIRDCGPDNEAIAQLILYLLTNDDDTRPLKTRVELESDLNAAGVMPSEEQLDLVLDILVGSGLILKIPESPTDLYQLVHDYLVRYIRTQYDFGPLAQLAQEKQQRAMAEEERDRLQSILAQLDQEKQQRVTAEEERDQLLLKQQTMKLRTRTIVASAIAAVLVALLSNILVHQP